MFDAVVRDKGNAKTDARQVDQKIIGIQLKSRYQIQTMFQKDLVEIFTGRRIFIQHQDRQTGDLLESHFLGDLRKMCGIGDEHILKGCQGLGDIRSIHAEVGMVGVDDVNLSLLQEVDAGLACRIGDADGYIRVEFVELLDIRHQKIAADGIAGADVELSQSGVVDILDLFFAAAYKVHGWFDVL